MSNISYLHAVYNIQIRVSILKFPNIFHFFEVHIFTNISETLLEICNIEIHNTLLLLMEIMKDKWNAVWDYTIMS